MRHCRYDIYNPCENGDEYCMEADCENCVMGDILKTLADCEDESNDTE
jgi:hypothetical protein